MDLHCSKLHWSYFISFNLSNVGEIVWVKSERTVCKFRKKKKNFVLCSPTPWGGHVKLGSFMSRSSNLILPIETFFFFSVRRYCCKNSIPIVAIQKFCYHGYMMSHFSFLLWVALIEYSEFTVYLTHGIWTQQNHHFHCKKILTLFLSSGFRCYYYCYCLKSMIILI